MCDLSIVLCGVDRSRGQAGIVMDQDFPKQQNQKNTHGTAATPAILRQSSTVVGCDYYYEDDGPTQFRRTLERTGSFIGSVVEMNTTRSGLGSSEQSNDRTTFSDADDGVASERHLHNDEPLVASVDLTDNCVTSTDSGVIRSHNRRRRINTNKLSKRQQQHEQEERERLIESLVSFSCHTPNAVLEDLISHELLLCRAATDGEQKSYRNSDVGKVSVPKQDTTPQADEKEVEDGLADGDESSVSSLSSDGKDVKRRIRNVSFDESETRPANETNLLEASSNMRSQMTTLPESRERESCLLFVDITGFTKLSRLLDVESLSRIINSYFDMIIDEVNAHGGDVLKFAGDALFVEWRVQDEHVEQENDDENDGLADHAINPGWVLRQLNTSLSSMHDFSDTLPRSQQLPLSVLRASMCAASIVRKYSDHEVVVPSNSTTFGSETNSTGPGSVGVLNVHCGIGSGRLMGFHVRDCHGGNSGEDSDGQEENNLELRREYLFLGDAIDQVRNFEG